MPIKVNGYDRIYKAEAHNLLKLQNNARKENNGVVCRGNNMLKNSHFNPMHSVVLKILDKLNPTLQKHPKIGEKILTISSKMLKNADYLK